MKCLRAVALMIMSFFSELQSLNDLNSKFEIFKIQSSEEKNLTEASRILNSYLPLKTDPLNKEERFIEAFNNQNKLKTIKEYIKNLNYGGYIVFNSDDPQKEKIFEPTTSQEDFFLQILSYKKYIEIHKFIEQKRFLHYENFNASTPKTVENEIKIKQEQLKKFPEQIYVIKKGENLLELYQKIDTAIESTPETDINLFYTNSIDYLLDIQHLEIQNALNLALQAKETSSISSQQNKPNQQNKNKNYKIAIITLIIASATALTYYLLITQTQELT